MDNRRQSDAYLELLQSIKEDLHSVKEELASHLSSPGHQYLDILMVKEAKRAALWDAIIEKTISGLIYSMLAACAVGLWAWLKEHFKWQ